MNDTKDLNPYEPTSSLDDASFTGLTRLQSILVVLLAVLLIVRGGFMLLSWGMQLASGFPLDSHYYAAIFAKDAIYGFSALIGGVMLLPRHKVGWWSALVHWSWYIAYEIVVVATTASLAWRVPVHQQPPALYRAIGFVALFGMCGIAILLWRPIAIACHAPVKKRFAVALLTLASSIVIAFAVNGWMSLR